MRKARNTRDLGLGGRSSGAGKGDAPRYKHDENWDRNFSEIEFPKNPLEAEGFRRVNPGKITKRYGSAKEPEKLDKGPAIKL